jgi:multicomponent Na+:H+ antiporter subunit C
MVYLLVLVLFCVGVYCIIAKKNLIKIIIGIGIVEYAINLLFVLIGYRFQGRAPILAQDQIITDIVDPLPQALVLTAIVIGLATTALLVTIAVRLYEKYGTFDITEIRKLKG